MIYGCSRSRYETCPVTAQTKDMFGTCGYEVQYNEAAHYIESPSATCLESRDPQTWMLVHVDNGMIARQDWRFNSSNVRPTLNMVCMCL